MPTYHRTPAAGGAAGGAGATDYTLLSVGQETMRRQDCSSSITLTSGLARFTYFTARKSETVTRIRIPSSGTAAGATPTLVKFGIYSVGVNGIDLTALGLTANETNTFAANNTGYTRTLLTNAELVVGQMYAVGVLVVTAATAPTIPGLTLTIPAFEAGGTAPTLAKQAASQTDLLGSYATAALADAGAIFYAVPRV